MAKFGVAQPVRRVEDPRLLKGSGRYTDDIVLPGMLHGVVVRSPHAAARIVTDRYHRRAGPARGAGGLSPAADLQADGMGPLPCVAPVDNRDGSKMHDPPHPVLARRRRCIMSATPWRSSSPIRSRRRATRRSGWPWTTRCCPRSPTCRWRPRRARRWCGLTWRATSRSTGRSATRRQPMRSSPRPTHVTRLTVVNNRIVVSSMEARACDGRFRYGDGALGAVCQHPGRLAGEGPDRPGVQHGQGTVPRGHAGRRRRLRHETVPVRRARADLLRGAEAGTAGEVGVGRGPRRSCATRRAATTSPWANWRSMRMARCWRCGRCNLANMGAYLQHVRAVHPDRGRNGRAGQRLWVQGGLRQRTGRVHQHRAGGCLSRRRPAGEQLPGGAADRRGGARAGSRPGRISPTQHGAGLGDAAQHAGGQDLRQRRFPPRAGCGGCEDGLRRVRCPPCRGGATRQAAWLRVGVLSGSHRRRPDRTGGNPFRR